VEERRPAQVGIGEGVMHAPGDRVDLVPSDQGDRRAAEAAAGHPGAERAGVASGAHRKVELVA
jgi:hypothetical protein